MVHYTVVIIFKDSMQMPHCFSCEKGFGALSRAQKLLNESVGAEYAIIVESCATEGHGIMKISIHDDNRKAELLHLSLDKIPKK